MRSSRRPLSAPPRGSCGPSSPNRGPPCRLRRVPRCRWPSASTSARRSFAGRWKRSIPGSARSASQVSSAWGSRTARTGSPPARSVRPGLFTCSGEQTPETARGSPARIARKRAWSPLAAALLRLRQATRPVYVGKPFAAAGSSPVCRTERPGATAGRHDRPNQRMDSRNRSRAMSLTDRFALVLIAGHGASVNNPHASALPARYSGGHCSPAAQRARRAPAFARGIVVPEDTAFCGSTTTTDDVTIYEPIIPRWAPRTGAAGGAPDRRRLARAERARRLPRAETQAILPAAPATGPSCDQAGRRRLPGFVPRLGGARRVRPGEPGVPA